MSFGRAFAASFDPDERLEKDISGWDVFFIVLDFILDVGIMIFLRYFYQHLMRNNTDEIYRYLKMFVIIVIVSMIIMFFQIITKSVYTYLIFWVGLGALEYYFFL